VPFPPPDPRGRGDSWTPAQPAPAARTSPRLLSRPASRSASDPTTMDAVMRRALEVDRKRAERLAQDLEWALSVFAGRQERSLPKTRRKQAKGRNQLDPVKRVLD
jgi:hypothetical protein